MVKPIYLEELNNNSTLTSNLSASNSCRTVRAGYTASAIVEDIRKVLFTISSTSYEPFTCFNKFLISQNYPPISSPQTLNSFFLHLLTNGLWSNLQDKAVISIKNDYSEAHIYLPGEPCPLPDYIIIPYLESIYLHPFIPLKSNTQHISSPSTLYSPLNLSICTHKIQGFNKP